MVSQILKFSAAWCGPCQALAKQVNESEIVFPLTRSIDVDSDEGAELAPKYSVRGLPTMVLLDENSNVIKKFVGNVNISEVEAFILESNENE